MNITNSTPNLQVLSELGTRIKDARIASGYTQKELSARSGVSERTITNLECGRDVTCSNLFSVLRALGMLSNLETLVPEQGPRPSDIARLGKKRQRASSVTKKRQSTWVWGEDR